MSATATATVELRASERPGSATWCAVVGGEVYPFGYGTAGYEQALAAARRFSLGKDNPREYQAAQGFDKVLLPALCEHGCGQFADDCQCRAVAAAEDHAREAADADQDFHEMLERWEGGRTAEGVKVAA